MSLKCPNCKQVVPAAEINVQANMAQCPTCHTVFKPSEVLHGTASIAAKEVSVTPPPGSRITMNTLSGGRIALETPRPRLAGGNLFTLIFTVFWLGFITLWTSFTLIGGVYFMSLFSIPFWLVGFFMLRRGIRMITTRQRLVLSGTQIAIERISRRRTRSKEIPLAQVVRAELKEQYTHTRNTHSSSRAGHSRVTRTPQLVAQSGNFPFFEYESEADKEWMVSFLNQFLATKRGK